MMTMLECSAITWDSFMKRLKSRLFHCQSQFCEMTRVSKRKLQSRKASLLGGLSFREISRQKIELSGSSSGKF